MGKPSLERYETLCVDCGVCYFACPNRAVDRRNDVFPRKHVTITVDGKRFSVPERTTVKRALELLGLEFGKFLNDAKIFAPCELGGCYACVLLVDGEPKPACVTPIRGGMTIDLSLPKDYVPLRRVSGYQPHAVGGVGTPWWIKKKTGYHYVEVACFAHGCNLRCPQCQNYTVTYDNVTPPSSPLEAAITLTAQRRHYGVNRMAISGGEPTLNRPWLTQFFRELRRLNPDSHARLHLDTNATILTPDYVDELIEAGVTDIGPDIKGLKTETFMRITGIFDKRLAERYLQNEWEITKYILDNYYPEKVFLGIGIPYNPKLVTLEEIREIGEKVAGMNPEVQVCLLDYFPTFRRTNMNRPSVMEMKKARETLVEAGLKTVLAQTVIGHIGP
jgi:pyruvate formate lyase activating enzyme